MAELITLYKLKDHSIYDNIQVGDVFLTYCGGTHEVRGIDERFSGPTCIAFKGMTGSWDRASNLMNRDLYRKIRQGHGEILFDAYNRFDDSIYFPQDN